MRIEIDKDGNLLLERGGRMKGQFCPHDPAMTNSCGDWCPLFREPDICAIEDQQVGRVEIGLCHCYIQCEVKDFTDKRKGV